MEALSPKAYTNGERLHPQKLALQPSGSQIIRVFPKKTETVLKVQEIWWEQLVGGANQEQTGTTKRFCEGRTRSAVFTECLEGTQHTAGTQEVSE